MPRNFKNDPVYDGTKISERIIINRYGPKVLAQQILIAAGIPLEDVLSLISCDLDMIDELVQIIKAKHNLTDLQFNQLIRGVNLIKTQPVWEANINKPENRRFLNEHDQNTES